MTAYLATADRSPSRLLGRMMVAVMLFLLIFGTIHYIHFRFMLVNVVLFSAVLDGLLATGVTCLILFTSRYFSPVQFSEKVLLSVIFSLTGYTLALSIPAVLDRSLSFYILEKLQQRGGGIMLNRMPEVFTQEYMKEHHLVEIRLTEQMEAGTVVVRDGCVQLTPWGNSMATASRFYRLHFLPTRRLLMGTYSAALVDPFQGDQGEKDYVCH
jgi:hypothetical protein